ncbi:hypothetical protein [Anabaena sp. CCY 0017]|uniref:hypothetical protein n=1 Tax=Anabaena sp. CCY 0017 TaxID=3103866 RepID=UPI0039C6C7B2
MGEQWVGESYQKTRYGPPHNYRLISQDQTRQYRPPMTKKGGQKAGQARTPA